MIKHQKKQKYGNQRNSYINLHPRDGLGMDFHSLLSRADARGSADIIYRMLRISLYRYFVGQA